MRLSGKTALVTGGGSGIGLATAQIFAHEGARVTITGRDKAKLDKAALAVGAGCAARVADVTDEAAMTAAAAGNDGLDIVVANAGVGTPTPLGKTSREAFERVIAINLTGVFLTVQACLPHLRDGASIIMIGSVHARLGAPGWSAYAASKGALQAMNRVLAAELAPRRIRVNLVSPGATRTPIWTSPEILAATEQRIALSAPLGQLSEAEEVARAALYLASDDAPNMTATEMMLDGGATGAPAGAPIYRR